MKALTQIKLHGQLGKVVGENWKLAVSSVSEAIRAIEILSKRKLYKYLHKSDEEGIKYKILINEREFDAGKELSVEDLDAIKNSELAMPFKDLKSVDIIPIFEGADKNIGTIIAGIVLIVIGVLLVIYGGPAGVAFGAGLIVAGLGLVVAGVINLLTSPPKFEDFREIKGGGRASYLFNGPENVIGEGGPVPIGYGRLIVGSQVISASYEISHRNADDQPLTA